MEMHLLNIKTYIKIVNTVHQIRLQTPSTMTHFSSQQKITQTHQNLGQLNPETKGTKIFLGVILTPIPK